VPMLSLTSCKETSNQSTAPVKTPLGQDDLPIQRFCNPSADYASIPNEPIVGAMLPPIHGNTNGNKQLKAYRYFAYRFAKS
jgi:hypothetical protein